jgi:hemerythrin-like domain-containing protein
MINDMIVIHNIAIRAVNAIYLQSVNVGVKGSPKDQSDFLDYCSTWAVFIHSHHDEEEEYVFPDIERLAGVPGLMGNNVEQHQAFHDGLETFKKYAEDAKEGKEKYDGQRIRDIIDSFMPALHKHLVQEIPSINGLRKFDDKVDWKKYWDEKSAQIIQKNQADPASAVRH